MGGGGSGQPKKTPKYATAHGCLELQGDDVLPPFEDDFYMMVTDWYPDSSDEIYERLRGGGMTYVPASKRCRQGVGFVC